MNIIRMVVMILAILLGLFLAVVIGRGIRDKKSIIGRPPVPVVPFLFAKLCVILNLVFLVLGGLGFSQDALFRPSPATAIPAVILFAAGLSILIASSVQLNRDLIFGLPAEGIQKLQTGGVYARSRHPFYAGFLLILLSSCLLYPHIANILAFVAAWIIHHFIMIREESFLEQTFGEEYRRYKERTGRYFTFKTPQP